MISTASLVMEESFEFGIECMQTRMFHEELSRKALIPRALTTYFKEGRRVATSLCRDSRGEVDREVNLKEVFSLIASVKADMVFMGGDMWYTDPSVEVPDLQKRRQGTFLCYYMTKEERILHVNSQSYTRDNIGRLFYLLSDAKPPLSEVKEGLVFDLINSVFDLENSPYATPQEHAEVLKGFGHALAIWDDSRHMQMY